MSKNATRYLSMFKEKEDWIINNIDKEVDSSVIGKRIVSINSIPIKTFQNYLNGVDSVIEHILSTP